MYLRRKQLCTQFSDIDANLTFPLNDSPVMHAEQPAWRHEIYHWARAVASFASTFVAPRPKPAQWTSPKLQSPFQARTRRRAWRMHLQVQPPLLSASQNRLPAIKEVDGSCVEIVGRAHDHDPPCLDGLEQQWFGCSSKPTRDARNVGTHGGFN